MLTGKHIHAGTHLFLCIAALGFLSVCTPVLAQDRGPDYIPTPNTVKDASPDPKKQGGKEKKIRYIITNNTQRTLAGNPCFEKGTQKMGFQYLAIPRGQAPNHSGWSTWWHNLGVKCIILMKNGPFWKAKVNKLYKECRYQTGDFVG